MFRNLFHPDNPLMLTMTQITDCIFFSLFWILGCIPVVTAGTSFAALYDASFRAFRQGEKHSWQRFAHVFTCNWKSGILPSLLLAAALWLLWTGMVALWNGAACGNLSWLVFSGAAFFAVLAVGILSVMFPMLSRFENSFPILVKNTVFLSLAHLPRTIALGVLNTFVGFLCLRFIFPLFFLPSVAALLGSFLIEPMFRPYLSSENAA